MKRSYLQRRTPLARGSKLQSRTPMKRVGPRTRAWLAVWRKLKPALAKAGITSCEIKRPGCWHSNGLTPAHALKRRNCTTDALLAEVCLGCLHCHRIIEAWGERRMSVFVRAIIASRVVPVKLDL